jgi:molybdopterin-containing oxidoreductase family membrane subunit
LAWGVFAILWILTHDHSEVFNTTDLVPWGLGISLYVFLVLTSTGLTFVASLYMVFGIETYRPIAKRAVFIAILALLAGFVVIGSDLGQPFRAINFMFSPNPTSAMWWMSLLYSIYLVVLVGKFWTIQTGRSDTQLGKVLGIATLISAIAAHSTLGAVFGFVIGRPAHFGAFMPVYFLLTALFSGFGAIMLFTLVTQAVSKQGIRDQMRGMMDHVAKHYALVIALVSLFFTWRVIVTVYPGSEAAGYASLSHAVETYYWHIEVWLGFVLPLILLGVPALRRKTWALVAAPVSALIGLFAGRMDLVLAGEYEPVLHGQWLPEFVKYTPSVWEWSYVILALSMSLVLYTVGEKVLGLADEPHASTSARA